MKLFIAVLVAPYFMWGMLVAAYRLIAGENLGYMSHANTVLFLPIEFDCPIYLGYLLSAFTVPWEAMINVVAVNRASTPFVVGIGAFVSGDWTSFSPYYGLFLYLFSYLCCVILSYCMVCGVWTGNRRHFFLYVLAFLVLYSLNVMSLHHHSLGAYGQFAEKEKQIADALFQRASDTVFTQKFNYIKVNENIVIPAEYRRGYRQRSIAISGEKGSGISYLKDTKGKPVDFKITNRGGIPTPPSGWISVK